MDLGIALPQFGPFASTEAIDAIAQKAESLGYASVWVQERVLRPANPRNGYGGMPGVPWPAAYATVFDPIETPATWLHGCGKGALSDHCLVLES